MKLEEFGNALAAAGKGVDPLVKIIDQDTAALSSIRGLKLEHHDNGSYTLWIEVQQD